MEGHLDKGGGEYPPCPTCKKLRLLEEWMDKDMKEFYMVRIGGN